MKKIIQIAPLLIRADGPATFVNVYGLSAEGGVYTWDAATGKWVAYVNDELAKNYIIPKPKQEENND